jgi:hypothetical protein
MDRFNIKSFNIGFEVPFFDLSNQEGIPELSTNISNKYLNWFDVLKTEISMLVLPNTNKLLLYTLIVRSDMDIANSDTYVNEWNEMKSGVKELLIEYFKSKNLEFRIIEEE